MIKIDLYNNHDVFIKESRQDWDVSKWLRSKGISLDDLGDHQQISDVIVLIHLRDNFWPRMNASEQAVWGAYWNIVYHKRYPLTKKFWNKFENIVKAIDSREYIKAQQRQQIKALRQNPYNNTDQDNEAKGSVPAPSKLHEKGTTGVMKSLSADLPW
jgi:hypothetical protein